MGTTLDRELGIAMQDHFPFEEVQSKIVRM